MKNLILLLAMAVALMQFASGQTVVYHHLYNLDEDDMIYDQVLLPDGGLLMTGVAKNTNNIPNILVMRTDEYGEPLFIRYFGGDSITLAKKIIQTNDNNFMIAGEIGISAYLLKINISGDSLWSQAYPDMYESGFKDILLKPDGGFKLIKWIYL